MSQDAIDQLPADPQQMTSKAYFENNFFSFIDITDAFINYVIDYPLLRVEGDWMHAFPTHLLWPLIFLEGGAQSLITYHGFFGMVPRRNRSCHPILPEPCEMFLYEIF